MSTTNRGPVVVDTDVFSARLIPDSLLARRYEPALAGRDEFISFQTLAEVRYGAQLRNWGATRLRRLETTVAKTEVVHSGDDLRAQLRMSRSVSVAPVSALRWASTVGVSGSLASGPLGWKFSSRYCSHSAALNSWKPPATSSISSAVR